MREEDEIRREDREKKMNEWLTRRGKIKRRGERGLAVGTALLSVGWCSHPILKRY
jgi:hypothetical protein